jgi:predicted nucleotidyltransferase
MELNECIDEVRAVLSKVEGIDYAYLFGSALRRLLPDSDVDILVGGELDFDRKHNLSMRVSLRLKRDVDIVLAKEAPHELVLQVLSRGKPIVVHDREALEQDYYRNYLLFDQNAGLRAIRLARVKKKYGHD